MTAGDSSLKPDLLSALPPDAADVRPLETASLRTLQQSGVSVAPIMVVPASVEERFYRLNNLVPQLEALFLGVDPSDPDEDDLEELAPAAVTLFKTHFLLDEFIDSFYDGLAALPTNLRVRRPGLAGGKKYTGPPRPGRAQRRLGRRLELRGSLSAPRAQRQLRARGAPRLAQPPAGSARPAGAGESGQGASRAFRCGVDE